MIVVGLDLRAVEKLPRPVRLDEIKATKELTSMALVRLSRLSVQPVTAEEFARISSMAGRSA